jgi:uncharacterized membrane protein|tara:strand:+ start:191 stop:352 length:162 start_codon:yes stop_codon:yes gene_type:complete
MNKYRKLIVAVVGLALLLANDHMGLSLPGTAEGITEMVVSAATAFGVWGVANV